MCWKLNKNINSDANGWGWVKTRKTYGLLAGRFRRSASSLRRVVIVTLQGRLQDPQILGHCAPAYWTLWQFVPHAFNAHPRVTTRHQCVLKVMSFSKTYHTVTLWCVVRVAVAVIVLEIIFYLLMKRKTQIKQKFTHKQNYRNDIERRDEVYYHRYNWTLDSVSSRSWVLWHVLVLILYYISLL